MPMRFSSIAVLSVSLFACTRSTEPTPAGSAQHVTFPKCTWTVTAKKK